VVGNQTLPAAGEDEPGGGTDDSGSNSDPSEWQLFLGNGAAHEDDEKGDDDRKNLGGDKLADGGGGDGSRFGLFPVGGEQDDEEAGQHPEEVAPTGRREGGTQCKEVLCVREEGGEEDEAKDKEEGAKPRRKRSAGAEK